MKRKFLFAAGILSIGVISGCGVNESAHGDQFETKVAAETVDKDLDKRWKDVSESTPNSEIKTVGELISNFNKTLHEAPSEKLIQAGFGEDYHAYLESQALLNTLVFVKVKGEAMEKDFSNMKALATIIEKKQDSSERILKSISYLQQLLNDLDIAVNDKEGKVSGYSYQASGDKTGELEAFIKSSK